MAVPLTTNGLIESIKRKGSIPSSQETFKTQDFIDLINEEMSTYILPTVLKLHQEFYATTDETEVVTSSRKRYKLPYRAVGNKLRDLHYRTVGGQLKQLVQISADDRSYNDEYFYNYVYNQFYLEGDEIVFVGIQVPEGQLVKSYYMRPNQLVTEDRACVITSIDRTTGIVMVANMPSIFASGQVDFIGAKSPNTIKNFDITPISADTETGTFIFDTTNHSTVPNMTFFDIPDSLQVGDYVMLAGETIVPQLPAELIPVLTQRVTLKCLEAMGDTEAVTNCQKQLDKMEANIPSLINNRVEGSPKKLVNRRSILRVGVQTRNRRF